MQLQIYLCLGQYILFWNQYYFAKALVGQNVKQALQRKFSFIACITTRTNRIIQPNRDLICTGTLISKKDVLLCEHCIKNRPLSSIQVIIGSINLHEGIKYYPLEIITFEQWAILKRKQIEFEENDIAIIKLTNKVSSEFVPAPILYKSDKKLYGATVTVAGWGRINNNTIPTTLQTVGLMILSTTVCEEIITKLNGESLYLEPRLLCTFAKPFALLQFGDSGGPLLYKGALIAVNKGTAPMPEIPVHPDKVNIHFNIKYYEDFISYVKKKERVHN